MIKELKTIYHFLSNFIEREEPLRVCVIGLGVFGRTIAKSCGLLGIEVLAIDKDRRKIDEIKDFVHEAIAFDATSLEGLRQKQIADFDYVIVAIGENERDNFIITAHLKKLGAKKIIARATSETGKEILLNIGADRSIIPEEIVGQNFVFLIGYVTIENAVWLSKHHLLVEAKLPPKWIGKKADDPKSKKYHNLHLSFIRRGDRLLYADPDLTFEEGDLLGLVGSFDHLKEFLLSHYSVKSLEEPKTKSPHQEG